ncbi:GntR family transcriptional regulator [Alcaligenaceae bacterium]|nr:GntR family transcriptional regulator [Alcaligenaceae bacterium]
MSFSASSFNPLWLSVAEPLRRRIVEGEILPGQPLSENLLATEFGVSRTPVREALRILMEEGLVEMLPGRKLRVVVPKPADIHEVYDIRWIIESEAIRRLTAQPERAARVCRQLDIYCKNGDKALSRQDRKGLALANEQFHEEIVLALDNRRLHAQFRTIYNIISLYRHQTLQSESWAAKGHDEHARLVDLIREGNTEAALALLRSHLELAENLLARRFAARGQTPYGV